MSVPEGHATGGACPPYQYPTRSSPGDRCMRRICALVPGQSRRGQESRLTEVCSCCMAIPRPLCLGPGLALAARL